MRQHRVYTSRDLAPGQLVQLEEKASRHLSKSLRLATGDRLTLFNGDGYDYFGTILKSPKTALEIKIDNRSEPQQKPLLDIHLGIVILKGERMDYALQKTTELNVSRITPLFSQYAVVQLSGERLNKRMQHWQGVINSACEQSGRCYVPRLNPAERLQDFLAARKDCFFLSPRASSVLSQNKPEGNQLSLVTGPEGGFSDSEEEMATDLGAIPVRLGEIILRAETAPVAAISAIQTLWGDFSQTSKKTR